MEIDLEMEKLETSLTLSDYDEEVVEVDAKNLVRKVGGVDQMTGIRNATGL
ncbi:MAG: phage major tail tube protein [Desulfovibrio sp.]|nr:phage major tail tube protein [Desulfovibrio sp.]